MSAAGKIPTQFSGHRGMQPWSVRSDYKAYKSPFGPKYAESAHFHGIDLSRATKFGKTAALFGASAGIFAFFFFAEVPRVRIDIVEKIPILNSFFKKEIAPEDNPF